jgi:hypothetical protein
MSTKGEDLQEKKREEERRPRVENERTRLDQNLNEYQGRFKMRLEMHPS